MGGDKGRCPPEVWGRTDTASPNLGAVRNGLVLFMLACSTVEACSRLTYLGLQEVVVTARSMDWYEDIKTDLWAIPAGITKSAVRSPIACSGPPSMEALLQVATNIGTTDGINTQGLGANLLFLSTTDYGKPRANRKNISILTWTQYFLDNYATVKEAVEDFSQDKFNMTAKTLPDGTFPTVHLAITDSTGDNAIFEYVDGKLTVHHGRKYVVMTNEPTYDKQLVLNEYWQNLKGCFLPGTIEPEDRFVRASFFNKNALKTAGEQQSIATAFSLIRNVFCSLHGTGSGKTQSSIDHMA